MNELKIFEHEEFGKVRTTIINEEIWFIARDVCDALDIGDTGKATSRLDEDELTRIKFESGGQTREMIAVNEPGLYGLILGSRKKEAKAFKRWIKHEVLPSLRKNGGYIMGQENMSDAELLVKALIVANNVIEAKNKKIEEMQPKADFFDAVADSKDAIALGEVAKLLNYPGIGRTNLFRLLRKYKVLDRHNIPYQKHMDKGYFNLVEESYQTATGNTKVYIKVLAHQSGIDAIRRFLDKLIKRGLI